ncbi:PAS domain S-box protein [Thalassobius vesicularis]|uniref:histidine kinase n=1 Tax=Thalassobius vesicularis TaxID=1294297 RepID=A0A4V3UZ69_9RHOB|nr:ATP-binding protein [Thalassobius vesicularis]THD75022.1 PAS domain S-box protein [Thalassobius vesicularis]
MAEAESLKLKPRWLQGGVLLLVSLIALALLLPLWLEVTQRLEQMRTSRRDNVIWTVVQLEVEFLELEKSATALKYAGASGLPEVRRRFNVFYSRVQTMQQSPLYREAIGDAGELENLAFVKSGVDSLIYLIDGADSTLIENQPVLMESLHELRVPIRRVVANANYVLTSKTEDARQEAARLVMRLGLVSVLLFGGLMGLALLFLRLFVVYKQRAVENMSTSRRLATVVATSPDAIIVTDASGEIQDFNPAAEVLLGYLREDALGMNLSALVETTSGGTVTFPFVRWGAMNERLSGLRRDGRVVPIELSQGATSLGRRSVYVFFLRDITERLAADEALLASRDKAVAGERAKAHFLAVMSHEMRTPLNGILGIIELLKDTVTGDKNRYYLSLLENSGQVLLNHINEVLDITEIEARGIRLVKTSYSLDAVLNELIASLRPAAEARGNSLTFTATPPVLGHFVGDAMRLRQVVANILSNAIKFTNNGSIEVSATVHRSGAGVQLDLQVADTGIGIDEDKLGIVFDDFVRLDREKTMQIEGTGLGLGIVRRIVRAMNGKCGVESVKGEGTLFWIELPLSEVMELPPLPIAVIEAEPIVAERALDVLLVEDNPTNRLVLHEMLSRGGHFVTEAENGAIGAELARNTAFDLILMDINMPVMGA